MYFKYNNDNTLLLLWIGRVNCTLTPGKKGKLSHLLLFCQSQELMYLTGQLEDGPHTPPLVVMGSPLSPVWLTSIWRSPRGW